MENFRVRLVVPIYRAEIKAIEAVNLSQVSSLSSAISRRNTFFLVTMKVLLNYAGIFYLKYSARFAEAQTRTILLIRCLLTVYRQEADARIHDEYTLQN